MKKSNSTNFFWILLSIVLILILVSLFVWDNIWNKVIFGSVSVVYLIVSLHKFDLVVLKDKNKQLLVTNCWRYATYLCFLGYIALFLEEILG